MYKCLISCHLGIIGQRIFPFLPRLLAITAFPGFVEVINNSCFWLWYNRLRTCNIFIVITKSSYFLIQIMYHCHIAYRHFLGNSDDIDESMTTCFLSNLNSFSIESQYSLTNTIPGDSLSARK